MEYAEFQPPPELSHLAKAAWTLTVDSNGPEWVSHVATPDGCVEVIHRLSGSSHWRGPQPAEFVAGVITGPAELRLGAGSRFVALRLWPWAWNRLLPDCPSPSFIDGWLDLRGREKPFDPLQTADRLFDRLPHDLLSPSDQTTVKGILSSDDVAGMTASTGRSHRWFQRWFAREIGLPPRTYLRLLRFNETFSNLASADGTLADHAAAHGFADQAHMAREFRSMSGTSAARAKGKATGPFL